MLVLVLLLLVGLTWNSNNTCTSRSISASTNGNSSSVIPNSVGSNHTCYRPTLYIFFYNCILDIYLHTTVNITHYID